MLGDMSGFTSYRIAEAADAEVLGELAIRSKAHWGYSESFLDRCRDELSFSGEEILAPQTNCLVAESDGVIVGFCLATRGRGDEYDLDALFVDPVYIRSGIGGELLTRVLDTLRENGGSTLIVESDPNAAEFYRSMGAVEIGTSESSSIAGRYLPKFRIDIRETDGVA
jgi:ribosomal protein S18 acetylase RimI-like enzyme